MNFSVIRAADTQWGMAFALELARQKRHLILIGRDNNDLKDFSYRVGNQYKVQVFYFVSDDSDISAVTAMCNYINDHYEIDCLINLSEVQSGIGFGDNGVVELSRNLTKSLLSGPLYAHQLLPNLLKQADACILQLSYSKADSWAYGLTGFNDDFSESFNSEMLQSDATLRAHHIKLPRIGQASRTARFPEPAVAEIVAQILCDVFCEEPASAAA